MSDFLHYGISYLVFSLQEAASSSSSSNPQKSQIHSEITELQVATVTTKMRQFWVNLLEEKQSTPSPPGSPKSRKETIKLQESLEARKQRLTVSGIQFVRAGTPPPSPIRHNSVGSSLGEPTRIFTTHFE